MPVVYKKKGVFDDPLPPQPNARPNIRPETPEERRKRWIEFTFAILFCLIVATAGISKGFFNRIPVQDKVQLGMSREQVRSTVGSPDKTQEMKSTYGNSEFWYYGDVQVCFDNDRVVSINRY